LPGKAIERETLLNLNDTDCHLNPMSFYYESPRKRVFEVRFVLNF
jgi:hypothetical protein